MKKITQIISIAAAVFVAGLSSANAATINVGTFEDENFGESGNCSLRAAVLSANQDAPIGGCTAGSGEDTIVLLAGTYTLTKSCDVFNCAAATEGAVLGDAISCSSASAESVSANSDSNTSCDDLDVYESLTIAGAGKGLTIITVNSDALNEVYNHTDYSFRAFDVHSENLQQGSVGAAGFQNCAEGCELGTSLLLKDLAIEGAEDTNGGAVRVQSDVSCVYSKLETQSVAFNENYADRNGGAVYVKGLYSASATDFDSNGADDLGGGLYLDGNTSCEVKNSILNSTFTNNTAYNEQGGALYADTDTFVEIAGSNFQGNFAYEAGGAIAGITGTISITNSNIANNGISDGGRNQITPIVGGGIFVGDLSDFKQVDPYFQVKTTGGDYLGQDGAMELLIQNTTIINNQALFAGGGIATLENFYELLPLSVSGNKKSCDDGVIVVTANLRDSTVKDNFVQLNFPEEEENETEGAAITVFPLLLPIQTGGGILHGAFGKFTIQASTIDSNKAFLGGGAANLYEMDIQKSTFSNNEALLSDIFFSLPNIDSANEDAPALPVTTINLSGGGGLFNAGSADVVNTTISGNLTDGAGAGILNYTDIGYVYMYSQLNNVEVPTEMGEVEELPQLDPIGAPGTRLNNDTIAANEIVEIELPESQPIPSSLTSSAPFYLNNGGGIAALIGKITLANTIVATNKDEVALYDLGEIAPFPGGGGGASTGALDIGVTPQASPTAGPVVDPRAELGDFAPDCYVLPGLAIPCQDGDALCEFFTPAIITEQHNLIGNNLGCTAFQPAANSNFDIVGAPDAVVDPLLAALANNGGTTLTHFLTKGSQAIDNGSGAIISAVVVATKGCQPDDQRSVTRPIDGNNDNIAICDIGAVEVAVDCDGVPAGTKVKDACGVCGGDGTSCIPTPTPVPDAPLACKETDVKNTLIALDGSAHNLNNLANTLIRTISTKGGKSQKANKKYQTQANDLFNKAWNTTWIIPAKIVSECTGGAKLSCATISNEGLKSDYSNAINQLYQVNQELLKQLNKLKNANKKLKAKLQAENDKSLAAALTTLGTVPSSTTSCK